MILDYRQCAKLRSTYTDKLPGMVNPRTGRVHTSYHQAAVATGRLSSSDPNLQNIPVRTEEGRRIREAFIAPEGWRVLAADYSQIELRIMAHLSGDPGLTQCLPARPGRASGHGVGSVRRRAGRGHARTAPGRQGDQFRADVRDERARPRATSGHSAQRCAGLHAALFRTLPRREDVHGLDPRTGPARRLRGDPVRPTAVSRRIAFAQRGHSARAPSAPRSTRPCKALRPTSSSARWSPSTAGWTGAMMRTC